MKASQTEEQYNASRERDFFTLKQVEGQEVRLLDVLSYGEDHFQGDDGPTPFMLNTFETKQNGKWIKAEKPLKINQNYLFPRVSWFWENFPSDTYDGVPTLGIPPGSNMTQRCWYFA